MAAIQDKSIKDTVSVLKGSSATSARANRSRGSAKKSIPIHVDGSKDELSSADPTDTDLADLELMSSEKKLAGRRQGPGTSGGCGDGGDGSGKLHSASRMDQELSRARPIKPHETEPFLTVGTSTADGSISGLATQDDDHLRPGSRRSRLLSATSRTSNCSLAGSRPISADLRLSSSWNVHGNFTSPFTARSSLQSQGRKMSSRMYVSPNSVTPRSNHHIKMPFKHSVHRPSQTSLQEPSYDLKELTALATYHVNRILSVENTSEGKKQKGKLVKGKLKPLYPVNITGPSIKSCRGILSDTRSYTPSPSRTLQRRRHLVSQLRSGELDHEAVDSLVTEGSESVHRVSAASSLDNLATVKDQLLAEQLLFNEDVGDEVLVPTKIPDVKSMQESAVDLHGNDEAQRSKLQDSDISDGAEPPQEVRSESYAAPIPHDTDHRIQGWESHSQTRRPHSASISYSQPGPALRQEKARPKTAQTIKSVRFADHSDEAAEGQPSYEQRGGQKDRMSKRLEEEEDGEAEEEQDKKRRKDNQGCKQEEQTSGKRKDDDENDDRDGGVGEGGGGRPSAAGRGNSSGSSQAPNSVNPEGTDRNISQSQGQERAIRSLSTLTSCTDRTSSPAGIKRKSTSDCEHEYCPSTPKEGLLSNAQQQQTVEEGDEHSWSVSEISFWATMSRNNNALSDTHDQAGGDGEQVVDDLKLLLAPDPAFSQKAVTDGDGKCSVVPKLPKTVAPQAQDSMKLPRKTSTGRKKNPASLSSADEILSNSCNRTASFHGKRMDTCWIERESRTAISEMMTEKVTGSCSLSTVVSTEPNQPAAGLDGGADFALKDFSSLTSLVFQSKWVKSCDKSSISAKTDLVGRPSVEEEEPNSQTRPSMKGQSSKTSSSWSSSRTFLANDLQDACCGDVEETLSFFSMPRSLTWSLKDLGRPPDDAVLDHHHLLELLLEVSSEGSPNCSLGSVTTITSPQPSVISNGDFTDESELGVSIFESCDGSGSDEEAVFDSSEDETAQRKGSSFSASRPKASEHRHANPSLKLKVDAEIKNTVSTALPINAFPQGQNSPCHDHPKQSKVTVIHDTDDRNVRVHVCRHSMPSQGKQEGKGSGRPKEKDSEQTNSGKLSTTLSHPRPCLDSETSRDPIMELVRNLKGVAVTDHLGNVLIDEQGNVLMDVHGNSMTEVMTHFSMNEGIQEKTKHSVKKKPRATNELVSKVNQHGRLITGILKKKGPSSVFLQPRPSASRSARGGNNNSQAEVRPYSVPVIGPKKTGSIDQEVAAAVKNSICAARPPAPNSMVGKSEKTCTSDKRDEKGHARVSSAKVPISARNKISRDNFQWMPVNMPIPSTSRKHKDGKTDYKQETVHSGKKQVFIATSKEPFVFGSDDVVGRALATRLKFGKSPYLKDMTMPKAEKGKRTERHNTKRSKDHLDSEKTLSDQSHSDSQCSFERRVKFPQKTKAANHNVNHNCCQDLDGDGCEDGYSNTESTSDIEEGSSENRPIFPAVEVQQLNASTDVDLYTDSMAAKGDGISQSQDAVSEEDCAVKFDSLEQEMAAVRSEIKQALWDRKAQRLLDEVEAATAMCNQDYDGDDGYVYEDNESTDDGSQEEYIKKSQEQDGREKPGNASDACVSFYRTVLVEYRNQCLMAEEGSLVLSKKLTWPSLLSPAESVAKAQGSRSYSSGAKTTQTGLRSTATSNSRPVSATDSFNNRSFGKSTRVRPHSASVQGGDWKSNSLHSVRSSSVQGRTQTAVSSSQKGWTRSSSYRSLTCDPATQSLETSRKRSGSGALSQKQADSHMKAGCRNAVDEMLNSQPCSTTDSGCESEGMSEQISGSTKALERQSSKQSLEGRRLSCSSASEADSGLGWTMSSSRNIEADSGPVRRLSTSTASEADSGAGRVRVRKTGNDVTIVYEANRSGTHKVQRRPSSGQKEVKKLEVIAHSVSRDRGRPSMLEGPPAPFPPLCFKITGTPPPGYLFFFAYATYMNPDRLGLLIMRKMEKRYWAVLFGFCLAFNKRAASERTSGLANIVFNPFESVEGCIFLLTPTELDRLDTFSDCPVHYSRVVLPVWMSEGDELSDCGDLANYCVPAVTYLANDDWTIQESCVPNEFVAAQCCKSASGMLSTNYCARLKSLFDAATNNTPIPVAT